MPSIKQTLQMQTTIASHIFKTVLKLKKGKRKDKRKDTWVICARFVFQVFYECIPLGGFAFGFVIQDHTNHGA